MNTTAAKRGTNDQGHDLLHRWQAARDRLSDGRRRLVDGILENLDEAVFLTSPELAARFDTDPATVARTVQALGYVGFADFARDLRSHFLSTVNPYRVMAAHQSIPARRRAAALAVLNLVFLISLAVAFSGDTNQLVFEVPAALRIALALPLLSLSLTLAVAYCAVAAWQQREWGWYSRLQYSPGRRGGAGFRVVALLLESPGLQVRMSAR